MRVIKNIKEKIRKTKSKMKKVGPKVNFFDTIRQNRCEYANLAGRLRIQTSEPDLNQKSVMKGTRFEGLLRKESLFSDPLCSKPIKLTQI
jgi:hypothetical protein